jgi:hypothetical protein
MRLHATTWANVRLLERPSGTWELLGEDRPCATIAGVVWYWCALRRVGHWRIYSGVMPVSPAAADDELAAGLEAVVGRCREVW